jgi:uncharacterized PurR-regulated membrane protein YhhQ (DUF165 family)
LAGSGCGLRVLAYRNGAIAPRDADAELYRLPQAHDAVWPPVARAYGGPVPPRAQKLRQPLLLAARLALPVMLTMVLLGASYLYADDILALPGMPATVRGAMLSASDLVLPFTWFSIHLTNRRYGPSSALAQLLAVLTLGALVMLINPYDINDWVTTQPALTWRTVLAFGAAFFTANFIAIAFFDAARGPRWWTSPLSGSFAVSFFFSAIYYPAAFAGLTERWTDSALVHFIVFFAVSMLMLAPYWLLRPAMRPMPGLNGY